MHFKTRSFVIILVMVVIMVGVGFLVSKTNTITGAAVAKCECTSDADCDNGDLCTVDSCLYPDSCAASRCIHTRKAECS